ncbi:MAG: Rieske 2Fe-2S domain-containing protein [Chloroflexi bacterium]|nr:Rieske 2Fe-2S domain-containing protein [Chloroflexota bacterium]
MTERGQARPQSAEPRSEPRPGERWRAEFPYHWDGDDLVSRRELLHFAVYTSGALFSCTTLLALLGLLQRPAPAEAKLVARVDEVVEGQAFYFRYPDPDDQAVLLHLPGGRFVAYSQKCTHLSCSVYYQPEPGRLFCPCHEGVFDPESGNAVAGPPPRRLPRVLLRREGELLYAVGQVP